MHIFDVERLARFNRLERKNVEARSRLRRTCARDERPAKALAPHHDAARMIAMFVRKDERAHPVFVQTERMHAGERLST